MALVPNVEKAPLFLSISGAGECANNSSHMYVSCLCVLTLLDKTTDLTPAHPTAACMCACAHQCQHK
jgi:hypothetical protein